jgi:hypothetical protein
MIFHRRPKQSTPEIKPAPVLLGTPGAVLAAVVEQPLTDVLPDLSLSQTQSD